MGPESPLPLPPGFDNCEEYIQSLLKFCTTSNLLHTLCGGVHILDFLTRKPELYTVVLPADWREWFSVVDVEDVLDLLMREDLSKFHNAGDSSASWRGHPIPPHSLIQYITDVRAHLLCRDFEPSENTTIDAKPNKRIFMGMNPKKVHEVDNFARYVDTLVQNIQDTEDEHITHLADFGAGQNYLGRVLASEPYNRQIIAIESRPHVVEGAKSLDVNSKLTKKAIVMRNKKAYRAGIAEMHTRNDVPGSASADIKTTNATMATNDIRSSVFGAIEPANAVGKEQRDGQKEKAVVKVPQAGTGVIQYIEHRIKDGDLSDVIENIVPQSNTPNGNTSKTSAQGHDSSSSTTNSSVPGNPSLLVMSLHSCGNLVHHGLRTLTLNPSVKAVALIGCCYNLMTERLGPPTHKLHLRPDHPRLDKTAGAFDPQGFPMSERFATYKHSTMTATDFSNSSSTPATNGSGDVSSDPDVEDGVRSGAMEEGIRLNITAWMMAVQAPQNWTEAESSSFFTRHFFRALLQRIFLDKGVVGAPPAQTNGSDENMGCSPAGSSWGLANGDGNGTVPVVIGNLKKKHYESFLSYVRGAVEKLDGNGGDVAEVVKERIGGMSDDEIRGYETQYGARKKQLSIVWSLMAFSAGVVEAMVVVDRWLWLKEQSYVKHAWVEPVFEYAKSPRNLVIVGIKK